MSCRKPEPTHRFHRGLDEVLAGGEVVVRILCIDLGEDVLHGDLLQVGTIQQLPNQSLDVVVLCG